MYRMSMIIAVAMAVVMYSGQALACATCGCGEIDAMHTSAGVHADLPSDHVMQMPLVCPGGCGMDGGLCGGCSGDAEALLGEMAVSFCPNCTDADDLCEMCSASVAGAMAKLEAGIAPLIASAPAHKIAYVEGTLSGDMDAMFGSLMAAASEQGLFGPDTHVGSVMPFALSEGFNTDSVVYAGVSFPADAEISDPLAVYEVPAGVYMMVDHVGPYEELGYSWMVTLAYAKLMGIELGDGACGEHYVSDPETTPADELLTQIFVEVAGHSDGRQEMGGDADPHAGHMH